jgi:HPt (histidine-containing phosphotransfer) domain-containing protein
LSTFRETLDGNEQLLVDVLKTFERHSAEILKKLQAAAAARDLSALGAAAHTLKGAAASIFAEPTRRLAEQLEKMGKTAQTEGLETALAELTAAVQDATQFIAAYQPPAAAQPA